MLTESRVVGRFKEMFAELTPETTLPLAEVYAPDVVFQDPFHLLHGRDALQTYFARMNTNIKRATFLFDSPLVGEGRAYLSWTMCLTPKHFSNEIVVEGATALTFDSWVTVQRDYFDGGAMVYENVPLLGAVVRAIKKRM